jgi:alkanesulfonate monooxygenase SsuD/methylene tetrahydromethanopterin reductase-like flavin-dependent oxidoreductase (luciferase family)
MVRVGIWQDLRNPPGWHRPWPSFYADVFDRIDHAEKVGIDTLWLTEHHHFEDGYLSQPCVWAAAVAARTTTIGIGTAIMIAPLRAPLDIAEQAALVDAISGGRFQLGLGAGYMLAEFDTYGVDIAERWPRLVRCVEEVRALLHEGGLVPPPAQDHLPLWLGALGPKGARLAGRLGIGLQWLDPQQLAPYREGLIEGGHDPAIARMCGGANLFIADDPERVWAEIKPNIAYQWDSYIHYGTKGVDQIGALVLQGLGTTTDPETLRSAGPVMIPPAFDVVTAEECVRRLSTWFTDLPVSEVYFWDSIAGMSEDYVRRHIELLATVVKPALARSCRTPEAG